MPNSNTSSNRLSFYYFLLFAGIIVGIILIRQKFLDDKLESNHKYTFGILRKFEMPSEGGEMGTIYYYLNGTTYRAMFTLPEDKSSFKIGNLYYIKYYPEDPDNCDILFEEFVPDAMNINNYPINGWDSLPRFQ